MLDSIGSPTLWAVLVAAVLALLALDFLLTRRPHEVSMREAAAWSAFYVALPLLFGLYVWNAHGSQRGLEYYTGYLVEKALAADRAVTFLTEGMPSQTEKPRSECLEAAHRFRSTLAKPYKAPVKSRRIARRVRLGGRWGRSCVH